MLTITAVLKEGGIYDESHIARLFALVVENMREAFVFQPVTDSPWPGWWAKMSLFEPGRFEGRVLYLDLDTTPCGPLDDLASDTFTMCRDWQHLGRLNSSVMAWAPGETTERIWKAWTADPEGAMRNHRGDQNFIQACVPEARTFPRRWCQSWKAEVLKKGRHPDCRVVVHHGRPRPWDIE